MEVHANNSYLLGDYELEPDKRRLTRDGEAVHLANRPYQVLLHLVAHRDRFVRRAELLDLFWEGKYVYDMTLTKCVGAIRKALNDPSDSPQFIETRYAEGYRYIGPVEEKTWHSAQSTFDIERTRGVKIVVEEEEIEAGPPETGKVLVVSSAANTLRPSGQ